MLIIAPGQEHNRDICSNFFFRHEGMLCVLIRIVSLRGFYNEAILIVYTKYHFQEKKKKKIVLNSP